MAAKPQDKIKLIVGQIAKRIIESGKKSQKRFLKTGSEIMRYGFAPDYNFEYQKFQPNAFFKAKVALTSEAFQVMVPYLFPTVPYRTVTAHDWAQRESHRRAAVMQDYLNYTPKMTHLREQSRRAITEALGYGRGVVWTGRDKKSGLVCSMWDSVRNKITDPNARTRQERHFEARKRVRPRFEVLAEYPAEREAIMKEDVYEMRPTDVDAFSIEERTDTSAECICYWELYLDIGIHNFRGGDQLVKAMADLSGMKINDDQAKTVQLDDTPMKYCVLESTGKVISGEGWEIPFFEDGMWPSSDLDLLDDPNSDYPHTPLESGLGYQRAINWLVTSMMGKYRFTSRVVGAIAKNGSAVSQKDKDKLLIGGDIELIEITVNGETKSLADFIQFPNFSQDYLVHGMKFLELLEDRFQKATGLYEILYAGETPRQLRSAQEAQMRERLSHNRIDDLKDKVQEWSGEVARKEALGARFLMNREDIGAILGPEAADAWGFITSEPPDVMAWAKQGVESGLPPQEALMMAQQQAAQATTIDQWRREVDYGIESGSRRRQDIDTQIDDLKEMLNQTIPTWLQSPDPAMQSLALDYVSQYGKSIGLDSQLIDKQRIIAERLMAMAGMTPDGQQLPPPPGMGPPGPGGGPPMLPGPPPPGGPMGPPPRQRIGGPR